MFQFIGFVVCAVAVSINSVEANGNSMEDFRAMVTNCGKQYGYTVFELTEALNKDDLSNIEPCFWGCAFTNAHFLNDHGQFDLKSGLIQVKEWIGDPRGYNIMEKVATQCESVKDKAVSDGEAGCERGTLAAYCFAEKLKTAWQSRPAK